MGTVKTSTLKTSRIWYTLVDNGKEYCYDVTDKHYTFKGAKIAVTHHLKKFNPTYVGKVVKVENREFIK